MRFSKLLLTFAAVGAGAVGAAAQDTEVQGLESLEGTVNALQDDAPAPAAEEPGPSAEPAEVAAPAAAEAAPPSEETAEAPRPLASAEMVLVRLCHAADLPTPDEAVRLALSPTGATLSLEPARVDAYLLGLERKGSGASMISKIRAWLLVIFNKARKAERWCCSTIYPAFTVRSPCRLRSRLPLPSTRRRTARQPLRRSRRVQTCRRHRAAPPGGRKPRRSRPPSPLP